MPQPETYLEKTCNKVAKLLSRRHILRGIFEFTPLLVLPGTWQEAYAAGTQRRLSFQHTHRDDALLVKYKVGDDYVTDALRRVEYFLRDHRTNDVHRIDPALLDLLYEVYELTGSSGRFQVISGYRSPKTNEALRKRGRGVAKRSQHLLGKAIDVRLTDVDTATLRDAAISLQRGGVGYYKRSDFVHLDTGPVRRW